MRGSFGAALLEPICPRQLVINGSIPGTGINWRHSERASGRLGVVRHGVRGGDAAVSDLSMWWV